MIKTLEALFALILIIYIPSPTIAAERQWPGAAGTRPVISGIVADVTPATRQTPYGRVAFTFSEAGRLRSAAVRASRGRAEEAQRTEGFEGARERGGAGRHDVRGRHHRTLDCEDSKVADRSLIDADDGRVDHVFGDEPGLQLVRPDHVAHDDIVRAVIAVLRREPRHGPRFLQDDFVRVKQT
jgi:hypothetical protein